MMWRSHIVIGAILAIIVFWVIGTRDFPTLAILGVFGALCALAPDLDHESSKGRKILDIAFIAFAAITAYLGACSGKVCLPAIISIYPAAIVFLALVGTYFILFRLFKPRHRGITHTLVACLVFGVLIYLVAGWTLAIAGSIGYLSHLFADGLIKVI